MSLKLTVFFGLDNYSWSEAIYLTTGVSPADGVPAAVKYLNARSGLLGTYVTILSARISTFPANRFVADVDPSLYYHSTNYSPPPDNDPTEFSSDRAYSSLLLRMTGAPYVKRTYLAGIPDSVIGEGPSFVGGYAGDNSPFTKALKSYFALLGSGAYGFRVRNKVGDVVSVPPLAPVGVQPTLIAVEAPAALPGVIAGSDVYLSGWRRINTKFPGLNGSFRVVQVNPSSVNLTVSYVLGGTGNVLISNFFSPGKIGPLVYQIQTIDLGSVIPVKAVLHKRGGSYGLPHGRSSIRR